jgi:hypothetical protein
VESALRAIVVKKNEKKPLSIDFVRSIVRSVDRSSLVDLRDVTIIALAYSLLLRHVKVRHICCNHLSRVPGGLKILMPSSKTDVYSSGKCVFLAKEGESTPVFSLLFTFLEKAHLHIGQNCFLFSPVKLVHKSGIAVVENKRLNYSSYRTILGESCCHVVLTAITSGSTVVEKGELPATPLMFLNLSC